MKKGFFVILLVFLIFGLTELCGAYLFSKNDSMNSLYEFLKGNEDGRYKPLLSPHPYLGNICTPGCNGCFGAIHNEHGYRGQLVPLERDTSKIRILFLGGSTTYSIFIHEENLTFPEQIKNILAKESTKEIEVINGGLPSGTSFELLQHYLFKYRYYKPDLVVIHTGGNDAQAYSFGEEQYQLDYGHFKTTNSPLVAVSGVPKALFNSKLFSYLYIYQFYRDYTLGMVMYHKGELMVSDTYPKEHDFTEYEFNAFYSNVSNLILSILSDNSQVVLVPFAYDKDYMHNTEAYVEGIELNRQILIDLSEKYKVPFCNIKLGDIPIDYFQDDCHLNSAGVAVKSEIVAKCIIPLL